MHQSGAPTKNLKQAPSTPDSNHFSFPVDQRLAPLHILPTSACSAVHFPFCCSSIVFAKRVSSSFHLSTPYLHTHLSFHHSIEMAALPTFSRLAVGRALVRKPFALTAGAAKLYSTKHAVSDAHGDRAIPRAIH